MSKRLKENLAIIIMSVSVIALTIGYTINDNLNQVTYSKTTSSNKLVWNMHFNGINFINSTVSTEDIDGPTLSKSTSMNVGINLKANDVVTFQLNVVNDGNVDASLSDYTFIDENANDNVDYIITYDDGSFIQQDDTIKANSKIKLLISVNANDNVINEKHNFKLNMNYYQK